MRITDIWEPADGSSVCNSLSFHVILPYFEASGNSLDILRRAFLKDTELK